MALTERKCSGGSASRQGTVHTDSVDRSSSMGRQATPRFAPIMSSRELKSLTVSGSAEAALFSAALGVRA